ncbi:hypothetical protein ACOMHN_021717 [Nucella lapillus]
MVGIAVGFLTPPELVPNSESLDTIATNLRIMFYGTAAVTTVVFLLNLFLFEKEPPKPPSRAQQRQLQAEVSAHYGRSLLNLVKNKGFVLLNFSYAELTMTGYLPVGFEFAAELTFPESEGTSSGLLNAFAQLSGIILTMSMRAMMEHVSVFWANITVTIILLCGAIITCLIWSRYSLSIIPKNYSLFSVNLVVGLLGLYQVFRVLSHKPEPKMEDVPLE